MRTRRRGKGLDVRAWPIRSASGPLLAVLLFFQLAAVVALVATVASASWSVRPFAVAAFMVVIAIGYEEAMARAGRLRLRLGAEVNQDMQAVWGVAAALALPRVAAVSVVLVMVVYIWLRRHRPAGKFLHREVFNWANGVLSCLAAGLMFDSLSGALGSDSNSWSVLQAVAAAAALLTFSLVNRLVITCALVSMRVSWRTALGSRDDNLIDLATVSLGGLVALAIVHAPLLGLLVLAPMITLQRGAVVRALEAAATTDAKTGLLNAVAWEQLTERELGRAAREHMHLAVLIVDVDHFKRVNDRFGHLAGDNVLKLIGRILGSAVREYDTVARFGGEEFVAVLPEADAAAAMLVAERLRAKVNELRVSQVVDGLAPESDELLAVSVGVSTCFDGAAEVSQLLHAADGALYEAKANGRNRVVLAGSAGSASPAFTA